MGGGGDRECGQARVATWKGAQLEINSNVRAC